MDSTSCGFIRWQNAFDWKAIWRTSSFSLYDIVGFPTSKPWMLFGELSFHKSYWFVANERTVILYILFVLRLAIFHCHVSFWESKLIFLDLHNWYPAFRADQPQALNDWMRVDFPIHRVLMQLYHGTLEFCLCSFWYVYVCVCLYIN